MRDAAQGPLVIAPYNAVKIHGEARRARKADARIIDNKESLKAMSGNLLLALHALPLMANQITDAELYFLMSLQMVTLVPFL